MIPIHDAVGWQASCRLLAAAVLASQRRRMRGGAALVADNAGGLKFTSHSTCFMALFNTTHCSDFSATGSSESVHAALHKATSTMQAKCQAAAAALGVADNAAYKALVASLHDEQLQQLEAILMAAKSASSTGSANLNADANPHASLPADAFACIPNVACLEPRGRWDILFSEEQILFRNKKGIVQKIERGQIATCVYVQVKAISGKIEHLFLVACTAPVQLVGMKKQPSVLGWKFPSTPSAADTATLLRKMETSKLRTNTVSSTSPAVGVDALQLDTLISTPERLACWLCETCLGPLDSPAAAAFVSSTGATHVQATHVVDTGCLHPLRSGLAFTSKPLLWLPFSAMESMECDQRGFGGHARYWDLRVSMKGTSAPVEFKNIAASEKDLVQGFLATRMGEVESEGGAGGGAAAAHGGTTARAEDASGPAAPDGDSEEEDSDFSEGGASGGEGGGSESDGDSSSEDGSDSDDGSEATFPDADDDNSVEFVEEDAGALSGAEEAAAAVAAEREGGRKRSRRSGPAVLVDTVLSDDESDDSDATQAEEAEAAPAKQARHIEDGDLGGGASLGSFTK